MPPRASGSSSVGGGSGSTTTTNNNSSISQHIKKFYGLLCDGGLNLPPFDEIQFGKITIGSSKKKSSFSTITSLQVKDAMILRRHVEKEVARRTKTDIENFCFALKSMIEDEYFFCLCLVPFESINDGNGTYFSSNESFFKLLLNISSIQMNIMDILFEELLTKCQDYEEENYEQWDKNIPKLIISQMRWLDMIVDSKKLTEHLSTLLQISSNEFTKELITAIPEIIDDSEHDNIVEKLDQVMQDKSEMTSYVIDALSNLNLKKEIMDETIDRVLRNLNSANLADLPVIIRFLLQSTNDDNIKSVVQGIRKDLDISSLKNGDEMSHDQLSDNDQDDEDENNRSIILTNSRKNLSSQKRKGKKNENSQELQCESLIVSALSTGIRHRKIIEKSFIQNILNEQDEHTIVDLWILYIIYSMPNYRKDAEQVLKKKIKSRKIDLNLLRESIEGHGQALEQIFSSLNELSSLLLRNTTDYQISNFGQVMYSCLFNAFKNDYNRQKIIQSLITHVGSNSKNEKDSSLDVLLSIAMTKLTILRNYSSFFQVLMDSLTNLTDQQLRKVYKLFSILSFTKTFKPLNNTRIRDELMIIIRKQLSNTNFNFKKMGIIGSCTILSMIGSNQQLNGNTNQLNTSNISTTSTTSNSNNSEEKQTLNNEEYEQAIELLDFSLKCCYKIPIFKTLLYDELCFIIKERNLDERLLQEIQTRLIHDFFQRFIIEKSDLKKLTNSIFEYKIQFSIDNSQQLVNILPLLEREDENIWNLFSQFRLMKIVMDKLNSDYSNFLLQSGIVLFDIDDILTNFKILNRKEKDLICTSLFFTINWFREILNGFNNLIVNNNENNNDNLINESNLIDTNNEHDKIFKYILERIETLNLLEKTLDKCLSMNLTFHLPSIGISNVVTTSSTGGISASSTKEVTDKKKKKDNDDDGDENDEEDEEIKTKSASSEYISLPSNRKYVSNLKIHYRELDLSVLSIIKYNLLSNNDEENQENQDNNKENNNLQPSQLFYLIEDLSSKLKSVISKTKVSFFTSKEKENHYNLNRINTNDFYEIIFSILPYLYKYVKIISHYSKENSESDEMGDEVNIEYITPCFKILIDIILKILEHFPNDFIKIINLLNNSNMEEEPEELIEIFYNNIKTIILELNSFEICYKLFELLKSIVKSSNLSKLKIDLQNISKHLLQTPFSTPIKSEALGNLITGLISFGSWVNGLSELVEFLKLKLEDEEASNYPNIGKASIPICIKKIFIELSNKISTQQFEWKEELQIQKNLKKILQVISFYKHLTALTKSSKSTPQLLQTTLIGSKLLLNNFLKLVRFLGKYLKSNKEIVIKIFTNLNRANRQVQTICIDRKLSLNKSLAKIIPKVKKDLESCNLKTKVILKQNGVESAITISVITDRDVTGKEASSQHFYSQLIDSDKKRKRKSEDDEDENEDENADEEEPREEDEEPPKKKKKKKKKKDADEEEEESSEKKKKKKKKKKSDDAEEEEEGEESEKKKKKKKKKKKSDDADEEEESEKKKKKKKRKKSSEDAEEDDDESEKKKKKKKKKKPNDDEDENSEEPPTKKKKSSEKILLDDDEVQLFEESLGNESPKDYDPNILDEHDSLHDFIEFGNQDEEESSNYDVTKSITEDVFMDDEAEEVDDDEIEREEQEDEEEEDEE